MIHLHLTAIIITVILFLITYFSYRRDASRENRAGFIMHMTLRLFYIIVLFSGVMIFIQNMNIIGNLDNGHMMYGIKVLLGLLVIIVMEMTLVREKKSNSNVTAWLIVAIILAIITFTLGANLPLGTMG